MATCRSLVPAQDGRGVLCGDPGRVRGICPAMDGGRKTAAGEGRSGKAWVSPVVFCCLCLFLALAPKALQHISSQSQGAQRDSREKRSGKEFLLGGGAEVQDKA